MTIRTTLQRAFDASDLVMVDGFEADIIREADPGLLALSILGPGRQGVICCLTFVSATPVVIDDGVAMEVEGTEGDKHNFEFIKQRGLQESDLKPQV